MAFHHISRRTKLVGVITAVSLSFAGIALAGNANAAVEGIDDNATEISLAGSATARQANVADQVFSASAGAGAVAPRTSRTLNVVLRKGMTRSTTVSWNSRASMTVTVKPTSKTTATVYVTPKSTSVGRGYSRTTYGVAKFSVVPESIDSTNSVAGSYSGNVPVKFPMIANFNRYVEIPFYFQAKNGDGSSYRSSNYVIKVTVI